VASSPEDNLDEFGTRLTELRSTVGPPPEPGSFVAYTDGACIGNPGFGGWGTLIDAADGRQWELWGHLAATTNNRAEALAVLAALEWVPAGSKLQIVADSELTLNILKGAYKIKANRDIWLAISQVRAEKPLEVSYEWVRGHAGHAGNERADFLSRVGAANGDVQRAEGLGAMFAPRTQRKTEVDGLVGNSPWEKEFLQSVSQQLRAGRKLSEKQAAIVEKIRARPS